MATITVTNKPTKSVTAIKLGADFTTNSQSYVDITAMVLSTPDDNQIAGHIVYHNQDTSPVGQTRLVVGVTPTVLLENPAKNSTPFEVFTPPFQNQEGATRDAKWQAQNTQCPAETTTVQFDSLEGTAMAQGKYSLFSSDAVAAKFAIKVNINIIDFVGQSESVVAGMGGASDKSESIVKSITVDNVVTDGITFNLSALGLVLFDFTGDFIDVGP